MPGFPVLHHLPELAQTHGHWWWHPTTSSCIVPFSSCLQLIPASGSFPMSQLFPLGNQSIGASASVLPMNIQDWFLLELTGLISMQSKGFSRVFSNTTVQKHKLFGSIAAVLVCFPTNSVRGFPFLHTLLSRVKQITSPGWMHETSAQGWCTVRPRGIGWRERWERGSGWGMHVNPGLIHVNVWQKPLQYCNVISLQLIKINGKKNYLALSLLYGPTLTSIHDYWKNHSFD